MKYQPVAYDYNRQTWVEGCEAKTLLISQLEAEISVLSSPDGTNYWRFIKPSDMDMDRSEYLNILKTELLALQSYCCGGGCKHEDC